MAQDKHMVNFIVFNYFEYFNYFYEGNNAIFAFPSFYKINVKNLRIILFSIFITDVFVIRCSH